MRITGTTKAIIECQKWNNNDFQHLKLAKDHSKWYFIKKIKLFLKLETVQTKELHTFDKSTPTKIKFRLKFRPIRSKQVTLPKHS